MLETIINEDFSSIWVHFHKHSRFTEQLGKQEAISLTPHWGKLFSTKNLWVGYSKWEDEQSHYAKLGEEFINDKCMFQ